MRRRQLGSYSHTLELDCRSTSAENRGHNNPNHFGFVRNLLTTDAMHVVRFLAEKHKIVHAALLGLEKAFDRVPPEVFWCFQGCCSSRPSFLPTANHRGDGHYHSQHSESCSKDTMPTTYWCPQIESRTTSIQCKAKYQENRVHGFRFPDGSSLSDDKPLQKSDKFQISGELRYE